MTFMPVAYWLKLGPKGPDVHEKRGQLLLYKNRAVGGLLVLFLCMFGPLFPLGDPPFIGLMFYDGFHLFGFHGPM